MDFLFLNSSWFGEAKNSGRTRLEVVIGMAFQETRGCMLVEGDSFVDCIALEGCRLQGPVVVEMEQIQTVYVVVAFKSLLSVIIIPIVIVVVVIIVL